MKNTHTHTVCDIGPCTFCIRSIVVWRVYRSIWSFDTELQNSGALELGIYMSPLYGRQTLLSETKRCVTYHCRLYDRFRLGVGGRRYQGRCESRKGSECLFAMASCRKSVGQREEDPVGDPGSKRLEEDTENGIRQYVAKKNNGPVTCRVPPRMHGRLYHPPQKYDCVAPSDTTHPKTPGRCPSIKQT